MGMFHPDGLWVWPERIDHGVRPRSSKIIAEGYADQGLLCSWAHEICTSDNEERALVIATMNEMAYVLQAWLPLIVWQQVDAPQYRKGYITVACISVVLIGTSFALRVLHRRQKRLVFIQGEFWGVVLADVLSRQEKVHGEEEVLTSSPSSAGPSLDVTPVDVKAGKV
jgi:hypothetical protein